MLILIIKILLLCFALSLGYILFLRSVRGQSIKLWTVFIEFLLAILFLQLQFNFL